MTDTPIRRNVTCPHCGKLQFVLLTLATGVIERKCDRCGEFLALDLSNPPFRAHIAARTDSCNDSLPEGLDPRR